jgi:hypothetical protein
MSVNWRFQARKVSSENCCCVVTNDCLSNKRELCTDAILNTFLSSTLLLTFALLIFYYLHIFHVLCGVWDITKKGTSPFLRRLKN